MLNSGHFFVWCWNLEYFGRYIINTFLIKFPLWRLQERYSFIHSFIGMCRKRRFFAVLSSFFHSSLSCTLSPHPVSTTSLPSFFASSCHLFLGLPVSLFDSKLILKKLFGGILFSSILCKCPKQHNLFSLIVSATVGFL